MSNSIQKKEQMHTKNGSKDGKTLYKLMNNADYAKTMET